MSTEPIIERRLLKQRLTRAARRGDPAALFLHDQVAAEFVDRLSLVNRHFAQAVDISGWRPELARRLVEAGRAKAVLRLAPFAATGRPDALIDDELLPLRRESVDLIVSALALQFANDLPGVLAQARRALVPDGLFIAALIGGDSLIELRSALTEAEIEVCGGVSPRVIPFADITDLGALLQRAGFALPVTDRDRVTVRYRSLPALVADLRAMAAGNALVERSRTPAPRGLFVRTAEIYGERYSDPDGRIRATFEIIWISGWAPHESQQRPLQPGSAKTRLADVLGTTEHVTRSR